MYIWKVGNGKKIKTVESWQEVTVQKFKEFQKRFGGYELNYENPTAKDWLHICEVVHYWSENISIDEIGECNKVDVQALYIHICKVLQLPENVDYTNAIEFENELYYLPSLPMPKSNVYKFVQAATVEELASKEEGQIFNHFNQLAAVLLMKKVKKPIEYTKVQRFKNVFKRLLFMDAPTHTEHLEEYNKHFDEVIKPQREHAFNRLTMADAFKVGFFLLKQSALLKSNMNTYFTAKQMLLQTKLKSV